MSQSPIARRAAASVLDAQPDPDSEKTSWLGSAVRALFKSQVRVRRVDGKLAVGLEPAQPAPASAEPSMRAELKALFDAAPQNRLLLRVLAAVEHGLKHKDPTGLFLFEVEPERLRVALRQFDGLAPATPTPGLAALRARIADALASRERKRKRMEMIAPRSDLLHNNRVEVAEVRATDFDRIHEQWKAGQKAD
jgi:hypothetical protein